MSISDLPLSSRPPSRPRPLWVMLWVVCGMLLLAVAGLALGEIAAAGEDTQVEVVVK